MFQLKVRSVKFVETRKVIWNILNQNAKNIDVSLVLIHAGGKKKVKVEINEISSQTEQFF